MPKSVLPRYRGKRTDPLAKASRLLASLSTEEVKGALWSRAWTELNEARQKVRDCQKVLRQHFGITGKRNPHGLRRYVLQAMAHRPMSRTEIYDRIIDLGFRPQGVSKDALLGRISALLSGDLLMLVEPVGHAVLDMHGVRWRLIEGGAARYRNTVKSRQEKLADARQDTRRQKAQIRSRKPAKKRKKGRQPARFPNEGVLRVEGEPVAKAGKLLRTGSTTVSNTATG